MSEYIINGKLLTNIANAVRSIDGSASALTPEQMETSLKAVKTRIDTLTRSFKSVIERRDPNPTLPSDLTQIGPNAFANYDNLALTSLPEGVKHIGKNSFNNCTALALTSLPSGLTFIDDGAFYGCTNLALISIPSGVDYIADGAFGGCTSLTSITFEGIPRTVEARAFEGCTNITTINVPWAEGAVSNAPWGATNATINYNYTAQETSST